MKTGKKQRKWSEMKYVCPMHPEIKQNKPGKCSKCGMKLVDSNSLKNKSVSPDEPISEGWKSYLPLIAVIGLILLTTFVLSFRDFNLGSFSIQSTLSYFMIGFFLVFAGFKLIDLKGFAEGYSTYDLLAKKVFVYGYIYPFIELFFGLAMIIISTSQILLISEFLIMGFSGIGVTIKLIKKEKFQCVCLGTFLKVPLTKVTLVEDFGMAALAFIILLLLI